jgi:hypothetical protein
MEVKKKFLQKMIFGKRIYYESVDNIKNNAK